MRRRILHAIHDFLPRHRAGSEIYACELARELSSRHDVFVLTTEYDGAAPHGAIRWRRYEDLPVIEVVNNWRIDRFEDTYRSSRMNAQLAHVLDITRPDVLHVHNLLNLSFDLPMLAHQRAIPSVATLHDYTLVCASGGQRLHVAESHVCDVIDTERCSRCFRESPFQTLIAAGTVSRGPGAGAIGRIGTLAARRLPRLANAAARQIPVTPVSPRDLSTRLSYARHVFDVVDLFVAPSEYLAREYVRLGMKPERIRVSRLGFPAAAPTIIQPPAESLRIGFVGTIVRHKGVHVVLDAVRQLVGPFELTIFGDLQVDSRYVGVLRRQAEGLPVRFAGNFDRADVPRIYGALDVLVVPSLWPENAPLVIQEAFMYGVPVIASRIGGIPEFIHDEVNGLLYDPTSVSALSARLQRLVDDRGLVRKLQANAPAIKTIAEDAREWECRYAEVSGRTSDRMVGTA
jgi:glycosyltransferase involved in cell wall biosynthesis